MDSLLQRVSTFKGDFQGSGTSRLALAKSGFYRTGKNTLKTYCCGLELDSWSSDDDPREKHRRLRPDCVGQRAGRPAAAATAAATVFGAASASHVLPADEEEEEEDAVAAAAMSSPPGEEKEEGGEADVPQPINTKDKHHRLTNGDTRPSENGFHQPDDAGDDVGDGAVSMGPEALAEIEALRLQNEQLRGYRRCKVCMDSEVSVVFLPCGHLVTCALCAPQISRCAVCRTVIKGTVSIMPIKD